jgi:hypothetical protein
MDYLSLFLALIEYESAAKIASRDRAASIKAALK